MSDHQRYPLAWPEGQPRQRNRQDALFKVDFGRSRDELVTSLGNLGARGVIISSNVPLRQDGLPMAGASEPNDPGVAVYFDRKVGGDTRAFVIACDTYRKVRWNLRAIGHTVEALRSIQRHGASSMLEQAFSGFAALPPRRAVHPPWWEVLGLHEGASPDVIRARFRELASIHHPDRGGDPRRMVEISRAYTEAQRIRAV